MQSPVQSAFLLCFHSNAKDAHYENQLWDTWTTSAKSGLEITENLEDASILPIQEDVSLSEPFQNDSQTLGFKKKGLQNMKSLKLSFVALITRS